MITEFPFDFTSNLIGNADVLRSIFGTIEIVLGISLAFFDGHRKIISLKFLLFMMLLMFYMHFMLGDEANRLLLYCFFSALLSLQLLIAVKIKRDETKQTNSNYTSNEIIEKVKKNDD